MNKSDFFARYPSTKFDFFENDEIEPDYEEQIRILISSIDDKDEMDQMYRVSQKKWCFLVNHP